jgi:hypothetical protein
VRLRSALIVLFAFAAGSSDLVALQFSMNAMACCAKAHNECARFSTPDDCCKGMGQGVAASTSTAPVAGAGQAVVTFAILPITETPAAIAAAVVWTSPAFKRPHDPPHLHPVPLLI